jgi:hypothetical protein
MNDIEIDHATKAAELINKFQARAAEILTSSAKQFSAAMDALNTLHSEFITDLGALGASTATQISARLDTTRTMQEEMLAHFTGARQEESKNLLRTITEGTPLVIKGTTTGEAFHLDNQEAF